MLGVNRLTAAQPPRSVCSPASNSALRYTACETGESVGPGGQIYLLPIPVQGPSSVLFCGGSLAQRADRAWRLEVALCGSGQGWVGDGAAREAGRVLRKVLAQALALCPVPGTGGHERHHNADLVR